MKHNHPDDNKNNYICPITQQIMREPVIASDGFTYEEKAIKEWTKKRKISPMTREPLNGSFYQNRLILQQIDAMEQNDPMISMERYQYDLKEFLKYYTKKYKSKIQQ